MLEWHPERVIWDMSANAYVAESDDMANSTTPVAIRPARPEDAPQIATLIEPFAAQQKLLPRGIDELRKLTTNGFVAEAEGCIVGFAAVEIYSKKLSEIQCLAVAAEKQGQGLGKRLIGRCVERAEKLGVLELMAITATEKLFIDCGFHNALPNQKTALFIQLQKNASD